MERKLKSYKPEKVMFYFENICNIPHVSHHTEAISGYCENFAKEHGLRYYRDVAGNVVIYKKASAGYENHDTVILQGHIDMVGAKTNASGHDFLKDIINIDEDALESGYITAVDTTLGADNGIAVAYMLAILDDDTIAHPPLEAVFTVDEEVGLLGASALDTSVLHGRYMINMDSEEEGVFITGCAGGLRSDLMMDTVMDKTENAVFRIITKGLKGGHSGSDIGTGRPSANVITGRVLERIRQTADIRIVSLKGGVVDNAICNYAEAVISCSADYDRISELCAIMTRELREEYAGIDDDILIEAKTAGNHAEAASEGDTDRIILCLRQLPYGVISRNACNINMVETSLNPGVMLYENGVFRLGYSIRSSHASAKRELADRIRNMAEYVGGRCEESGDYPSWPHRHNSLLCRMAGQVYNEMYHKDPAFEIIHAGLECGIFAGKMPELDIISYGPDMYDVHTYDERLSIRSAERVYDFTLKLLEKL